MRFLLLSSLVLGGAFLFAPLSRGNQQPSLRLIAEDNVNSRYTVESIEVAGEEQPVLPESLRERVSNLIGARFDPAQFDELAREIRKQLHLRSVSPHILRGSAPDRVRVLLQTERKSVEFDVSVPKFLYHSSQGWSAQVQGSTTIARDNVLRFGLVSDGDELTERFDGFNAAYENLHTGTSRIHTALVIQELHEQWNQQTVHADGAREADLYRTRRNLQPEVVFVISRPLTVTVGASFEQLQMESPGSPSESANAILADVHYDRPMESSGALGKELEADYDIRFACKSLASDYAYTRHRATLRYTLNFGRNTLSDEALAGVISGTAPLYERFVLGTSSLLRGWNRYEIDPLGGNRVIHNSVEYSFRINPGNVNTGTMQAFYDAGALWNQGQSAPLRQSVGVGYRQSVFSLALAFPMRDGRTIPVFMVGMNY